MADEFQIGSGNWWDSPRTRFDSGSSTTLSSIGSFGWATEIADNKARPSMDSGSSNVFQDTQKLQGPHQSGGDGGLAADSNLQMMGIGLSTQAMDWNQALLRGGKGESSFRSLLQEDLSSNTNYQQESGMSSSHQEEWRQKIFSGGCEDSPVEFKQINRPGFSLDQPQLSSHISSGDSTTSFQMDSDHVYGSPASTMLQGLVVGSDNQHPQQSTFENRSMNNYQYPPNSVYGMNSGDQQLPSWSKYPQYIRASPPKQPPHSHHLHFSNNAPFWNASAAAMNSSFFPSLQIPTPSFDEKPKNNTSEVGPKKSSHEASTKRPRNDTTTPLPAFKVRKEKMGDRITALQQLVSPFGKTDTASVLSEAIEYIKFLHDQINVLSTPYMKSGAPIQHQQNSKKSKEDPEGAKQDLRSRGLCLVPVSSTYPVTHETTVDFWTPTFGGTFR